MLSTDQVLRGSFGNTRRTVPAGLKVKVFPLGYYQFNAHRRHEAPDLPVLEAVGDPTGIPYLTSSYTVPE
eukprot:223922-Hanusia_phi.AAC.3